MLFASDLVKLIKNELNALSSEENNEFFQEIYEVLSIDTAKYLEKNHTQKDIEDMTHMQVLTHSLTYSLTYSLTHLLTHSISKHV